MNLYYEALQDVRKKLHIEQVYRFQGGNSQKHISIENERILYPDISYVYFSATEKHHRYFVTKRLKQLIEEGILSDINLSLTKQILSNTESYGIITSTIPFNERLQGNSSLIIHYYSGLFKLLKENMHLNLTKNGKLRLPEKTDMRTYGGSYGLSGPWLRLFNHITLAVETRNITNHNILSFIEGLRRISIGSLKTSPMQPKLHSLITVADFLNDIVSVVTVNNGIFNPFTKYEIMQELETILEQGLLLPTSTLVADPKGTKKRFITSYLEERDKFLETIDSNFSRKLEIQSKHK